MSTPNFLLYESAPGQTRLLVRVEDESVWLSQAQMGDLFQTSKQNISLHIRNVFEEGELSEESVVKECLTTAADGKSYRVLHYNLDVIISVGYRVRSHVGTRFRIWATVRLRDYVIKGFALDDQRLKEQATVGPRASPFAITLRPFGSRQDDSTSTPTDGAAFQVPVPSGGLVGPRYLLERQAKDRAELFWAVF